MASELKPWRYEIKYGPDGEDSYSWVYDDQGVMVAPMRTHKAKEVVDRMNTRPAPVDANLLASNPVDDNIASDANGNAPAATDTGLETYAHDNGTLSGLSRNEHGPWCLRSQVEELLAAERAKSEKQLFELAASFNSMEKRWNDTCERLAQSEDELKNARADNAAKDARVKHFEDAIKTKGGNEHSPTQDAYDLACKAIEKNRDRAEALEAKLAAAKDLISRAQEIIPGNYMHWHDFARAVLGGKPS